MERTIINFFDRQGAIAGILEIDTQSAVRFHEPFEQQLQDVIQRAYTDGLEALSGVSDEQAGKRLYLKERVYSADPRFIPTLIGHVEYMGYGVVRRHPKAEAQLKELLKKFPDEDPLKRDIMRRMPAMSHLEMTALIEELQK